ncbi:MAG TPA: hypothetical protein ENN30_00065 [Candidatus Woesearchaeota archaeon]|nr:hypothetical protein [Candidatus Woesearchaeota archaeon]
MKDLMQIQLGVLVSTTGGVVAGVLLAFYINRLELIPGILILLPGFLQMCDSVLGSLSARLGSALHLGTLKPVLSPQKYLMANLFSTSFLMLAVSLLMGFLAFGFNYFIFGKTTPELIFISVAAAALVYVIVIPLVFVSIFFLFNKNIDPDNVMGPYITTVIDIVGIGSLLTAIMVIA